MARPRRPPPVARSPARAQGPAAAATPRQASPARPRRGRRLLVQSPSLASARRVPAPAHAPPPATPPLRWPGDAVAPRENAGSGAAASVRRIAAALWRAHPPPREPGEARRRPEPSPRHPHTPDRCNYYKAVLEGRTGSKPLGNGIIREVGAYSSSPRIEMEVATKWDRRCLNTSGGADYDFCERRTTAADEEVSALKEELMQARNRIQELEAESLSAKKKLDHLVRNLAEEKASWRSREHDKVRRIVDAVKGDLNRERKNRQRAEFMNSKLMDELSELKLLAKRYLQDYEKERKARELMEEVCDELAKEIADDKAEVEALKHESMKVRDEVEEERKMLQMAEVWREERVQMKLVDAKLTLDSKYSQLTELQAILEAFLSFHRGSSADKETVRDGERLREAICSMKLHGKEFSYKPPPPSEDIFAVFEELRQREDINEKEIVQCNGDAPVSHATKIHTVSPETDIFLEKPANKYSTQPCARNEDEDDSGWETVSHAEQGSSNSPDGSEPSVNGFCGGNDASASGTDWEEDNCKNCRSNSGISGVCSTTGEKYRKKGSSFSRLWRSSNGDGCRKTGSELLNGRFSSSRMSNADLSPDPKTSEVCQLSPSVGDWSPDLLNPHVVRAMKGRVERPQGAQKHNLKSKLLDARTNGRKVQLRHALEQKI
ncbi:hypothetical protein GQ55_3G216000 [Panicum hallii var. hallii]|uniref:Uncharacterized protein n=1 Tax=Panicum hallii var. hallii TaxID=1504633 RepID=A0A2T7EC02_9POAL|nr:hypothetical protein GQ55_3G216000 [Panicum hallii var. hallii]